MNKTIANKIIRLGNKKKAEHSKRFFKTGKGEYAEGDIFLGINNPTARIIAKKYKDIKLPELKKLLYSKYHEARLIALFILTIKYKRTDEKEKREIYNFYLQIIGHVNNWDLVDLSAPSILGDFLLDKDKSVLYKLARSKSLWSRRIAIVSTLNFIRNNQLHDSLNIISMLLNDKEDLIHKACGWMLREIGKKNKKILKDFLEKNIKKIPRTTLRYSIERFPENERKYYLNL